MGSSTGVIYLFTPLLRLIILRDYNDHNKIPLRKQVSREFISQSRAFNKSLNGHIT
jgi:hypothetical protein